MADIEKTADLAKKKNLLAAKKEWRSAVSLLIAKLIAFKRGVNGHGDEDAHLPPVDLKNPFPPEYRVYLSSIISDYTKVIDGAEHILQLQDDFSKNRRKKQSSIEPELTAEATWWGSRAWSRLSLFGLKNKQARKLRIDMINSLHRSISDIYDIENFISTRDRNGDLKESDGKAALKLLSFVNLYHNTILNRLNVLDEVSKDTPQLPPGTEEGGDVVFRATPPKTTLPTEELGDITKDIHGAMSAAVTSIKNSPKIDDTTKATIENNYLKLMRAVNADDRGKIADLYQLLKKELAKHQDVISQATAEDDELRVIAHNILTRWLNKQMLNVRPDKFDKIRLVVIDDLHDVIRNMRKLMDLLENPQTNNSAIAQQAWATAAILESIIDQAILLVNNLVIEQKIEQSGKALTSWSSGLITQLTKAKKLLEQPAAPEEESEESFE